MSPKGNVQDTRDAEKHVYDKVKFDSATEEQFSEAMDQSEDVELYVKLPSGFYLNTPMGRYNPDWAITLKDKEGIKHVYFVTETKGDSSQIQLRWTENAKIACAKKHFAAISNGEVQYHTVSSFEEFEGVYKK